MDGSERSVARANRLSGMPTTLRKSRDSYCFYALHDPTTPYHNSNSKSTSATGGDITSPSTTPTTTPTTTRTATTPTTTTQQQPHTVADWEVVRISETENYEEENLLKRPLSLYGNDHYNGSPGNSNVTLPSNSSAFAREEEATILAALRAFEPLTTSPRTPPNTAASNTTTPRSLFAPQQQSQHTSTTPQQQHQQQHTPVASVRSGGPGTWRRGGGAEMVRDMQFFDMWEREQELTQLKRRVDELEKWLTEQRRGKEVDYTMWKNTYLIRS
eukprot:TRINITY_DN6164_c0_g1_i1.p1 TRINITY_DN6164_c0_g1~~TRINITY_DN6164_c0_g1_i1.p1  ORF type:complete len:272 (+),score=91.41 TRINITY_DN6164_c0_g1_i1:317-1132(+)